MEETPPPDHLIEIYERTLHRGNKNSKLLLVIGKCVCAHAQKRREEKRRERGKKNRNRDDQTLADRERERKSREKQVRHMTRGETDPSFAAVGIGLLLDVLSSVSFLVGLEAGRYVSCRRRRRPPPRSLVSLLCCVAG